MSTKETGFGHIYKANNAFHTRFYITIRNGHRVQKSLRICTIDAEHPTKDALSVVKLAADITERHRALQRDKQQFRVTDKCPTCGRIIKKREQQEVGENRNEQI